jgi:hypothetical protein
MPTLVLSSRYTSDSNAIWKAAIDAGWSVERLHSHRAPEYLRERELAFYGEGLFVRIIAEQLQIVLLECPFDWLTRLPNDYLKREIRYTTLGTARQETKSVFVKPAGDKSFDAKVYLSGDALPDLDVMPETTPVLIAEPVTWEIEFRCFVLERQVQTLSAYARFGQLTRTDGDEWIAFPEEQTTALDFCNQFLSDESVKVPPGLVLDIGVIAERGWAVLEANPAWASGIYGCDPAKILPILTATCADQQSLTSELRHWVVHQTAD